MKIRGGSPDPDLNARDTKKGSRPAPRLASDNHFVAARRLALLPSRRFEFPFGYRVAFASPALQAEAIMDRRGQALMANILLARTCWA